MKRKIKKMIFIIFDDFVTPNNFVGLKNYDVILR